MSAQEIESMRKNGRWKIMRTVTSRLLSQTHSTRLGQSHVVTLVVKSWLHRGAWGSALPCITTEHALGLWDDGWVFGVCHFNGAYGIGACRPCTTAALISATCHAPLSPNGRDRITASAGSLDEAPCLPVDT